MTSKPKVMKNEGDVKSAVKAVFTKVSAQYPEKLWFFMPPANGYGRSGIPDFIGGFKGNLFGIETKFDHNAPTAHQMNEMSNIIRSGGRVWLVRETSLEAFENDFYAWCALCS